MVDRIPSLGVVVVHFGQPALTLRCLQHLQEQRGIDLEVVLVDNSGLAHFRVEVIALTGALADAGENRITAVAFGDVIDEFHDDDGLADACTTECAHFAALGEGANEIDDLDAGLEDLGFGVLL